MSMFRELTMDCGMVAEESNHSTGNMVHGTSWNMDIPSIVSRSMFSCKRMDTYIKENINGLSAANFSLVCNAVSI